MTSHYQKFKLHTILLHWIVGLGMIGMIVVGLYMTRFGDYGLYPIHKSIGVILFVIIMIRVVMRVIEGWPTNISTGKLWEHKLARVVHWVLILGTVALPISGVMMSYFGGHGVSVFGFEILDNNKDPETGRASPINMTLGRVGSQAHTYVGYVLIGAIILHVAGALKHHVMDKDNTLRRMLGRAPR
jgi:cytochrome b561